MEPLFLQLAFQGWGAFQNPHAHSSEPETGMD